MIGLLLGVRSSLHPYDDTEALSTVFRSFRFTGKSYRVKWEEPLKAQAPPSIKFASVFLLRTGSSDMHMIDVTSCKSCRRSGKSVKPRSHGKRSRSLNGHYKADCERSAAPHEETPSARYINGPTSLSFVVSPIAPSRSSSIKPHPLSNPILSLGTRCSSSKPYSFSPPWFLSVYQRSAATTEMYVFHSYLYQHLRNIKTPPDFRTDTNTPVSLDIMCVTFRPSSASPVSLHLPLRE